MSVMVPVQTADGQTYRIDPRYNLRFFFPQLVSTALDGLREPRWEDWYRPYCEARGLTEADLEAAWRGLAGYAGACLASPDQSGPLDALEASGFLAARPEARLVVLAKLGQLLAASLWWPLREGTHLGESPDDLARLAAAVEAALGPAAP